MARVTELPISCEKFWQSLCTSKKEREKFYKQILKHSKSYTDIYIEFAKFDPQSNIKYAIIDAQIV